MRTKKKLSRVFVEKMGPAAGDFATSETFDKCDTAPACRSSSETTAVPEHGSIFFGRAISRPSGMSPQGSAEESN